MLKLCAVPDFRSSNGLFQTLRGKHNLKSSGKDLFDASVYKDSTSTASFHAMVRELSEKTREASPTPFHHLLATLAHDGRLLRLYSQNVDCIDTKLPPLATTVPLAKPWPKTIQVHGGLDKMVCSKCQTVSDLRPDLFTEPLPPSCSDCVATDSVRTEHAGKRSHGIGKLRPRMVLYNEHNPDAEAIGSVTRADLRSRPDAVIVAGTTLKVPGVRRIAREMCNVVRDRRDGVAVWINNDPEPTGKDLENCWDLVVRGPCDEVAKHAAMRKWTDDKEDFEKADEVTEDHVKKVKDERGLKEIAINAPSKSRIKSESDMILTPLESPTLRPQQVTTSTEDGEAITKKGKKIRTILSQGKASQSVANRKAKPKSKKPAQAKKAESIKINTVFSASKPMKPGARGEKAKNKKDDADSLLSKTRPSTPQTPMAQIPPQDVRNNSSPLSSPPSELEQPSPTYKTQEDDTIHPVGCIPSGFANLLATSPT